MRDDGWLTSAISRYHELCADPHLGGPQVVAQFVQAQRDASLTFGGKVQCRSLRPAFITNWQLDALRQTVTTMWHAFHCLESRALADPSLAAALGMSAQEQALARIDPGYNDATVVSRLDTYFTSEPRVLEYNADSPAGMSYQAGQAKLMQQLPVMMRFAREYAVQPLRADVALRETLIDVWREFATRKGMTKALPTVAIVDLAGAATSTEFVLVAYDLAKHGIEAFVATPEELRYASGLLTVFGRPIDLVYKRLLVADFIAHYDMQHPLVRAYADGAVCVASSFRCTIAHKKKALSILRDPHSAAWFDSDQRAAIARFVAPTFDPRDIDRGLLEDSQTRWAIKPNDAHGGEDVVLGWDVDARTWRAAIDRARNHDYVVQERVEPALGTYPLFDPDQAQGGAQVRDVIEDCNAYVFRGKVGGVLTRLSGEAVINVSRGAQAIPTFVIAPKNGTLAAGSD